MSKEHKQPNTEAQFALQSDSGSYMPEDVIKPNYEEMTKEELIIYCEYLKLLRYPVKWEYVNGNE